MDFVHDDASVAFDAGTATVRFTGILRLPNAKAYDKLTAVLMEAAGKVSGPLTLDVRTLQFLNSSGITTLSMFVIAIRAKKAPKLIILGSRAVAWQQKSLSNFKKLWSDVELVLT